VTWCSVYYSFLWRIIRLIYLVFQIYSPTNENTTFPVILPLFIRLITPPVLFCVFSNFRWGQMKVVYWVFWTFPSSGILETRKHDVSETGSVSILRWEREKTPTQLGPLERANLNHWTLQNLQIKIVFSLGRLTSLAENNFSYILKSSSYSLLHRSFHQISIILPPSSLLFLSEFWLKHLIVFVSDHRRSMQMC
jgi:hypothetical protein